MSCVRNIIAKSSCDGLQTTLHVHSVAGQIPLTYALIWYLAWHAIAHASTLVTTSALHTNL
jgi:hypothetical protein